MKNQEQENQKDQAVTETWTPRKSASFIKLSEIEPEDRTIKQVYKTPEKFENIEKIQFKCQPRGKDTDHISLDGLPKLTPIKEIIYRILVNHRRAMKLGDIVEKTMEVIRDRKLAHTIEDEDINKFFYRIIKGDVHYGFEEVE